ncbi:hypothetical protein THAR02_07595 [Trichoderma harzianum]|uniref:Uncharacterized protein n=1 Tax=Trichoderma harzianum TaxID=5544 RepID=A0A0F9X525_TRIHA|nr:hypothetical protein THAR02_07595 [Trichoderma harzianum]
MAASNTPTRQHHNPITPNSEDSQAPTTDLIPERYIVQVHPGVDFVTHLRKVQRLLKLPGALGSIHPDSPLAAMGIYIVNMPANVAMILQADGDVKYMQQDRYVPYSEVAASAVILAFELLAKIAEAAEQLIAVSSEKLIQAINNDVYVALSCS